MRPTKQSIFPVTVLLETMQMFVFHITKSKGDGNVGGLKKKKKEGRSRMNGNEKTP